MPSLSDSFNNDHTAEKMTDSVLVVNNGVNNYYYDFVQRFVSSSRGDTTPFSQLDREVVIMMRDKLVALGGAPPELPPEAPSTQAASRKFNL